MNKRIFELISTMYGLKPNYVVKLEMVGWSGMSHICQVVRKHPADGSARVGQLVDSRSNTILSQIVESLFASQIVDSNSWILKTLSDTIFNQIVESIYQYNYCSQIVGLSLICSKKLHFLAALSSS